MLNSRLLLLPLLLAACASDSATTDESDLTSITARTRKLEFQSVVYVADGASDTAVLDAVRAQTKTAFGALRNAEIAVNSRELKEVDPKLFVKKSVVVKDPNVAGDPGRKMLEVRYTYRDQAVVAPSYSKQSSLSLALLGTRQSLERDRILKECTANDEEAHDFPLWYVFDATRSSCVSAIKKEQSKISKDRGLLEAKDGSIVAKSEAERLYLPITIALGKDETNGKASYPEYERLFRGGVQKDKLVIGIVYGLIDHEAPAGGVQEDSGYGEWMENLREIAKARPELQQIESIPPVDVSTVTLSTGKKVDGLGFDKFMQWNQFNTTGMPAGLTGPEKTELKKEIGKRLYKHWFRFEAPVKVKIGSEKERDFGVQILTYFGVESDQAPHKFGIKNSDVYLYNGHSYIGSGPLDPSNFTASDFPKSYQILFIDGCVSYNYYHKNYIPLKEGGTKNLDLITNGMEAPAYQSGFAMGQLVGGIIGGKMPSYRQLLQVAADTDRMRVVDGELDNEFSPTKTKIVVK